jgi:DNA-binding response OmpR family regulator
VARGGAKILLVDDEQSVQTLLTYPLRKEGYEVVTAANDPESAIESLVTFSIRAIGKEPAHVNA